MGRLIFNNNGTLDNYTFVLSNVDHTHIGPICNIDYSSAQVNVHMSSANEISFTVHKYLNDFEEPLWEEIDILKQIYCLELDEYFVIDVSLDDNGQNVTKTITGTSASADELAQAKLYNIEINSENDISREDYDDNFPTVFFRELENIDSKYEHIWKTSSKYVVYQKDNPALVDVEATKTLREKLVKDSSLLHRILSKVPQYSIGHVDDSLKNIQRTFSVNDTAIYDWLVSECAEQFNCLFTFDTVNKTINAYDLLTVCQNCGKRGEFHDKCPECGSDNLKEYGKDTSIFVDCSNLSDSIKLTPDTSSIKTCFKLEAGDDLMTATVRNLNPTGSDYIYYWSDYIKSLMPTELKDKLEEYERATQSYNDEYQNYISTVYDTIDKIQYFTSEMMPDTEMDSKEIIKAENEGKILEKKLNNQTTAVGTLNKFISKTTIESTITNYAKIFIKTGFVKLSISSSEWVYNEESNTGIWTGSFLIENYSDEEDSYTTDTIIVNVNDDYESYLTQKVEKAIYDDDEDATIYAVLSGKSSLEAFTEWIKFYCLNRLVSFRDAIESGLTVLWQSGVTDDTNPLYSSIYLSWYNKMNACDSEIAIREASIKEQETIQANQYNGYTDNEGVYHQGVYAIQKKLNLKNWLGEHLYDVFCSFRREDTFSNSNYNAETLKTNDEIIALAKEFREKAEQELIKAGTPQYTISSDLYNLFLMEEFKPLYDYFEIGNWIRIGVDGIVYKLRLIGYTINFGSLTNISVEFSDVIIAKNTINDFASLVSSAKTMASSYSTIESQVNKGSDAVETIKEWKSNGLSSALTTIKNNKNEEITFSKRGLLGRSYDDVDEKFLDEQSLFTHNILAYTTDNWKTVRSALGYHTFVLNGEIQEGYGLNADYLISALMISGDIYSSNYKSRTINEDGSIVWGTGTHFDLNNGSFTLGDDRIEYDSLTNQLILRDVTVISSTQELINLEEVAKNAANAVTADTIVTAIANIDTLTAEDAIIKNIFNKNIVSTYINAKEFIGDKISTTDITISSDSGGFSIIDNTLSVKDKDGNKRVQLGEDAEGNFSFLLLDATGKGTIINENGITENAIADGLIRSNMVASKSDDYAGLDASKLDIDSVVEGINGGSTAISAARVYFDKEEMSLNTLIGTINTNVQKVQGALKYDIVISSNTGNVVKTGTVLTAIVYSHGTTEEATTGITYQWYKNGIAIADATSKTYTVNEDDIENGVKFTCKASYE